MEGHLHSLTLPPGIYAQAICGSKFLPRHCSVFMKFIRNPLLQFSNACWMMGGLHTVSDETRTKKTRWGRSIRGQGINWFRMASTLKCCFLEKETRLYTRYRITTHVTYISGITTSRTFCPLKIRSGGLTLPIPRNYYSLVKSSSAFIISHVKAANSKWHA